MTTLEMLAKFAYEAMRKRMVEHGMLDITWEMEWEKESQRLRDDWMAAVRAALVGLKEPTEVMYQGVCKLDKLWRDSSSYEILNAMLDGILEEEHDDAGDIG